MNPRPARLGDRNLGRQLVEQMDKAKGTAQENGRDRETAAAGNGNMRKSVEGVVKAKGPRSEKSCQDQSGG